MKVLGDMHDTISFNSLKINQMGDAEPVAELLSKFTRLAEVTEEEQKQPANKGKK